MTYSEMNAMIRAGKTDEEIRQARINGMAVLKRRDGEMDRRCKAARFIARTEKRQAERKNPQILAAKTVRNTSVRTTKPKSKDSLLKRIVKAIWFLVALVYFVQASITLVMLANA